MIARMINRWAWLLAVAALVGLPSANAGAQTVATLQSVTPDAASEDADESRPDEIQLEQILATNAFAVAKVRMVGNKLTITGTTKGKRKKVTLDGAFKTTSSGKRVFSFSVKYMPADCIATLASEGKELEVAVRNCGQTGPAGATGRKGKRGPQGEAGAAGPQGATGDRGPRGKKGATGDAGPQGPDGPIGSSGFTGGTSIEDTDGGSVTTIGLEFTFIGDTRDEELPANIPIIATSRGAAQVSSKVLIDICYQSLPGGKVETASEALIFLPTSGSMPIGQTVGFEVPTTGTYRIGLCANTDDEQLTVDWFYLWLLAHEEPAPDAGLSATAPSSIPGPGIPWPSIPWTGSVTTIRPGGGS